ncbi:MAG: hypothetical protein M1831_001892 [Alyxoria varia]|nr:MAG: hypothetical protein M1831_001892 [Alyxoria varia]
MRSPRQEDILNTDPNDWSLYGFDPVKALPIVFGALVLVSALGHAYQTFIKYKWYKFGYFMLWGSTVWIGGFVMRAISYWDVQNVDAYISQLVLILAGPPIYAAAEYFVLGQLLHYLPYHSPLHPGRVVSTFLMIGAAVEGLSAAGAASSSSKKQKSIENGTKLIEASLILQAIVEILFSSMVAQFHYRCKKAGTLPRKVHVLCLMLYATSMLITVRCIFRVAETFEGASCETFNCGTIAQHEWLFWVFEVAVMVLYIYMLNILHPGQFLPREARRKTNRNCERIYLDPDGKTERMGPGWVDNRSFWVTVWDPFDFAQYFNGQAAKEDFWEKEWPTVEEKRAEPNKEAV